MLVLVPQLDYLGREGEENSTLCAWVNVCVVVDYHDNYLSVNLGIKEEHV